VQENEERFEKSTIKSYPTCTSFDVPPHNKQTIKMILCFGDKFELSERIGSGSFGEIFFTRNVKTGEDLATKLEKIKNKKASSQLRREAKIYLMLNGTGD